MGSRVAGYVGSRVRRWQRGSYGCCMWALVKRCKWEGTLMGSRVLVRETGLSV